MRSTRLVLVRHGETDATGRGRCYGRLDVPLSDEGRAQATRAARALAAIPIVAVYTSPRVRTRETADILAAGRGLSPRIVEDLRELDFGEIEGRRYDEIAAERPDLYAAWMRAPTTVTFPGGEGYGDLRARVLSSVGALRARHAGETFAVVSHGGPCRAVLADALAMPDAAIFRIAQSYAGISVIDWVEDTPIVRAVNAISTDGAALTI